MRQERTDAALDSLLDRGGLGAARRDAILSHVLAHAQAERSRRPRRRWAVAAFGSAAAAAAVLLLAPWRSPQVPSVREKGTAGRPASTEPSAELDCLGATLGACPKGSLIVVHAANVRGFLSAWAEPEDGGERIWYFSAESSSPLVDALSTSVAASRAVKLGPEHAPGSYVVHVRVTAQPMARDQLVRLSKNAALAATEALLTVTSP
jgi:hypothetical protein